MSGAPGPILLVENDADLRDALVEVLSAAGFPIASTHHGLEAIGWLERNPNPALVLLDLWMPRMEGWALLDHLHTTPRLREVTVVVITPGPGDHPAITATLRKPFDEDTLLLLVRRCVGAPA